MLQIQTQFVALHPMLLSSLRVRHPIRFRPPPDQIAFAARSDCVRRPIGLRPPSNRVASAVRLYNHRMYTLSTKSDSNTYCCVLRRPETSATFFYKFSYYSPFSKSKLSSLELVSSTTISVSRRLSCGCSSCTLLSICFLGMRSSLKC